MDRYIHLDTDALDALPPAEAYQAATQIHDQAKALGAAYANRLASDLAAQHGQQTAADMLGIHQSTLAKRVTRHKKETPMQTHTTTHYSNALGRKVSRTWTQRTSDLWETDVDGTRWVLHYNGKDSADRLMWEWGPAGRGLDTPKITASTVENAMKEAMWYIDIRGLKQK